MSGRIYKMDTKILEIVFICNICGKEFKSKITSEGYLADSSNSTVLCPEHNNIVGKAILATNYDS